MDAIAGFMTEYGVIVLLAVLAAIGLLWLLSRFFKLTLVIVATILILLAFQHYSPSGDLKTKVRGIIDKITAKAGDAKEGTKEFFSDQKDKMHRHMNEALTEGEKKEAAPGQGKKGAKKAPE